MKRNLLVVTVIATLSLLTACGGKTEKKAENKTENKEENKAEAKLSTEMQDFMLNFNGRSASVRVALDDFGKPGLDRKDMDLYDLDKPVVLESTGNCHLMQFESGMTKRKYNVCWEGGKISSIEDKGME
ncbi:MAG: hypothetical protein IPG86_20085 [Chitinophagaceae bacterium]|nr:hypothetical protein [Chitinophagaceae bacterium]